ELREHHNYSPLEVQVGKDYYTMADSVEAPNPISVIRSRRRCERFHLLQPDILSFP
ncbi:hypothetical protein E3A20_13580, partial [Planctomyces bekefii]